MPILKKIYEKTFLTNQIGRIHHRLGPHLDAIRENSLDSERVKRNIRHMKRIHRRIGIYYFLRDLLFFLLYASVISAFTGDLFLIGDLSNIAVRVSGVAGATLLLLGVALFNKLIDLDIADAYVIASEIISVSPLK